MNQFEIWKLIQNIEFEVIEYDKDLENSLIHFLCGKDLFKEKKIDHTLNLRICDHFENDKRKVLVDYKEFTFIPLSKNQWGLRYIKDRKLSYYVINSNTLFFLERLEGFKKFRPYEKRDGQGDIIDLIEKKDKKKRS